MKAITCIEKYSGAHCQGGQRKRPRNFLGRGCQGCRFRRGRALVVPSEPVEVSDDSREDRIWGVFCLGAGHTQRAQAERFERSLALGVSVGLIVDRAVYLDDQACLGAIEVNNETVNRVLAA